MCRCLSLVPLVFITLACTSSGSDDDPSLLLTRENELLRRDGTHERVLQRLEAGAIVRSPESQRFRTNHGILLLYVTHGLALARQFCDRVLVLNQGVIVEDGPSARVLDAPEYPYTQRLAAASRELGAGRATSLQS